MTREPIDKLLKKIEHLKNNHGFIHPDPYGQGAAFGYVAGLDIAKRLIEFYLLTEPLEDIETEKI